MFPTMILLVAFALGLAPAAQQAPRERRSFRLYKFQQPIGVEDTILVPGADGAVELRTVFSFTDRRTTVPLGALLVLDRTGAPRRFQVW